MADLRVIAAAALGLVSCSPCAGDTCGCWEPITIDVAMTLVDGQTQAPVPGIELYCPGDADPRGSSDEDGTLELYLETRYSDNCLYYDCTILTLRDPTGTYEPVEVFVGAADGATVELDPV